MRVVCPGSFDPVTNGHLDIITRAAATWDEVTVLVTYNPNKNGLFTAEERADLIRRSLADHVGSGGVTVDGAAGDGAAGNSTAGDGAGATPAAPRGRITVDTWDRLLVDYLTEHGVTAMVKGLRSSLDYEYELPMAQMNRRLSGADTYFLFTNPRYGYVSSTLCKEVARYGGDVTGLLPEPVVEAVTRKFAAGS
ncbi:pantetheine-phosphate adenylyltransferase [Corynebacterium bovis]|uniref:pantetheine-phosphate adenylyltransferase n=1 Tax=Corynebacterium bovis TaxID=36808 RepID=UPI000F654EA4|nr:pantetheine-phosphate adenylyltransferase [Corynebacterium bovis]RRO79944.1 pantetheine-phosphate adenylyltransferase [Corynebacterium bovis]RRO81052.1 pantetheine-phosphate adenylyltransferase [Corynebacterium bovis]RRO81728.1 pantetheine-phosphate adenylyltransferase [Corynebacterium bovis]RRO92469.1 pantetheine-phosphate adenylyltransferase [Corynebacterium bovis]RRO93750.1 pantetheine-phosphate adenylyltransferase [Corynebacterium bovis]